MKMSVESKIVTGCAASLIALGSMGWLSYVTTANLVATENWVAHTQEVIATLEPGLAILTDAETQQRGYLLTGDARFLQDSKNSQTQAGAWVEKTRRLTADNPEEQQRLNKLELLIGQRLSVLNDRIKLRQEQGLQTAADAVALRQGKNLMDQIWRGVSEMRDSENQLLQQRERAAQTVAQKSLVVIIIAAVLAFAIGIIAVLTIRRDLRLRQQAQDELDRFFALSLDFLCIASVDGYFKRISPAVTEILGWSVEEFLARPFIEFVHPDDREATMCEVEKQVVAGEKVLHFENRYQCKDGSWRTLSWRSMPQPGGLMYATARDVTEQKMVESELRHSRAVFENLFVSLPGLYLVLTPELKIAAVSDAYLKATMTQRGKIIGRGLFEIFPDNPDDSQATGVSNLRASLDRVLQNLKPDTMAIQKYDVRRPDGIFEERFWSPVNSPVLGGDHRIEYIIHRVEDVTEFVRKKQRAESYSEAGLNERLEQMEAEIFKNSQEIQTVNEQLRLANQELESFSYSVSHDLRAPLRHIDGFVKLLDKHTGETLDAESQRYLKIIADAARQMGVLIDDLLVFSRMGRTQLQQSKVSLDSLVHEAVDALQMETQGRHIDWKIRQLPEVQGDPAMLRMVWVNLIANAAKYSRARNPAEIEINCVQPSNGEHIFSVRDNGVGFDMKYADKLFGVFQRLHRADEFEGTGIGLANVRRIVARHGGRTWAEGKVGGGATFFFSLPNKQTAPTKG